MNKKKICMLGSFGVGKTSLVSQFVRSVFSEKYLSTIGVKIDRKTTSVNGDSLDLILWDIAGEDRFEHVQASYLAGASGFLLVIDGCRFHSLEVAHQIYKTHQKSLQDIPFICLINKSDLRADWEITTSDIDALEEMGWNVSLVTAKDKNSVETVFQDLSHLMIRQEHQSQQLATH